MRRSILKAGYSQDSAENERHKVYMPTCLFSRLPQLYCHITRLFDDSPLLFRKQPSPRDRGRHANTQAMPSSKRSLGFREIFRISDGPHGVDIVPWIADDLF